MNERSGNNEEGGDWRGTTANECQQEEIHIAHKKPLQVALTNVGKCRSQADYIRNIVIPIPKNIENAQNPQLPMLSTRQYFHANIALLQLVQKGHGVIRAITKYRSITDDIDTFKEVGDERVQSGNLNQQGKSGIVAADLTTVYKQFTIKSSEFALNFVHG
uniref:Uncharacterized protein n=1 Tax=Loa loa TaxID=7209 RepID=A0A1I7W5S1_LOALO